MFSYQDNVPVAGRLRAARKEAQLTPEEVADAFRRPVAFVLEIESGERRVDPVELYRLAVLYGKPVSWFLESE